MALYPITNVPLRSAVCTIIAKGQTHHNPRLYPIGTKKALDSQESLSLTRDKSHGGFVLEKHQLDRLAEVANPCLCISLRHRRRRTSERGRERECGKPYYKPPKLGNSFRFYCAVSANIDFPRSAVLLEPRTGST